MAHPSVFHNSATPAHVPKWKKLGLKLKTARDDDSNAFENRHTIDANETGDHVALKRKTMPDGEPWPSERAAKRSKDSNGSDDLVLNGITQLNKHIARSIPSKQLKPQRPPLQKRKSVTFAPEAKAEDGNSISQYKERINAEHASLEAGDNAVSKQSKKKAKHQPNNSLPHSAQQQSTLGHLHLDYLTTYHTSPDKWKFSKRHQNHLLKHLFDLTEVPSSFDPILVSYLSNLQGFNARKRIRDQALQVRQEDDDWLNEHTPAGSEQGENPAADRNGSAMSDYDPDRERRRRDAYKAEIARLKSHLRDKAHEHEDFIWEHGGEKEEWERHCRKRKRAEYVLWSVGESESKVNEEAKAQQQPNMSAQLQSQQRDRMLAMGQEGRQQQQQQQQVGSANNTWMLGRDAARINGAGNGAVPKKITFDETASPDGIGPSIASAANGQLEPRKDVGSQGASSNPGNAAKKPRKRRRKQRTGVPDDDDDDTSSSSSDDDSDVAPKGRVGRMEVDGSSDSGVSGSSSDGSSGTEETSDESD